MKNTKVIWISISVVVVLLVIVFILPNISSWIARVEERGAIGKSQAMVNQCNGTTSICIVAGGKIVSKQITNADTQYMQRDYATPKDQHIQYAANVAAAVAAIRAYTHIPDLNLSLLNSNTPTHISYYCSPDNKCWAVDNQTHQIVSNAQ